MQQHTATRTAIVASLSPLATQVTLVHHQHVSVAESTVSTQSRLANGAHPSKQMRKLCELPSNWYRRMSPSTRCASFQIVVKHSNDYKICIHSSKLPTPTKTSTLWHCLLLTFTWRPSHCGVHGNVLANMAAKEGTTVEQEEENHHHDSAKAAIRQVTKEPPINHERLRHIYGERGEKRNQKLENLQLSRKDQASISRMWSGHHPDLKLRRHRIGTALDIVCRKCGMGEETVEHVMGECP